jgi:hypothetical protein
MVFMKNAGRTSAMESGEAMNAIKVSWSGGKDARLALQELRKRPDFQVMGLLATITHDFDRISTHGVVMVLLQGKA